MTNYLSVEGLLHLVADLGVGPVRDVGLIDSAAHRPQTILWGREVYASLDEKAAALLDSLIRNHALGDGNRRLGWLGLVVFYAINGVELEVDDDDAFDFVVSVASGEVALSEIVTQLGAWTS
ncbi:type II toxin-antitoxin system death-on-curing family toxin [Zhihengliuella somnathii]